MLTKTDIRLTLLQRSGHYMFSLLVEIVDLSFHYCNIAVVKLMHIELWKLWKLIYVFSRLFAPLQGAAYGEDLTV